MEIKRRFDSVELIDGFTSKDGMIVYIRGAFCYINEYIYMIFAQKQN